VRAHRGMCDARAGDESDPRASEKVAGHLSTTLPKDRARRSAAESVGTDSLDSAPIQDCETLQRALPRNFFSQA